MVDHPTLPESWIAEAERLRADGEHDAAFAAYRQAWEIRLESYLKAPQAHAAYDAALMMIGIRRFDEAVEALAEVSAIGDWQWAEAGYHRAVLIRDEGVDPWSHLEPGDPYRPDLDVEMRKGFRHAVGSDDPVVAAAARDALRDLGEEVPEPSAHDVARTNPDAAAALFAVRASGPDAAVARDAEWQLHAIRRHQGRHLESAEHARRAIALDPPGSATVDRFVRLAAVLVPAGLPLQALVALDAGLGERSVDDEPAAWRVRVAAQTALGRHDEARESRARLAMTTDDREDPRELPVTLPLLASFRITNPDVAQVLARTRPPEPRTRWFRRRRAWSSRPGGDDGVPG